MTPEQRRRNRNIALILLALVAAVFVWTLSAAPCCLPA